MHAIFGGIVRRVIVQQGEEVEENEREARERYLSNIKCVEQERSLGSGEGVGCLQCWERRIWAIA